MINQISFRNYKAFNEGVLNIKPITVFLGANSVGKSSIIQLLLMLQQTALSDKYKSALRLHGEFVSLGENENIFKRKNTNEDLEISFNFKDTALLEFLTKKLHSSLIESPTLRPVLYHLITTLNSEKLEKNSQKYNELREFTKTPNNKAEFIAYFEKFMSFSKNIANEKSFDTNFIKYFPFSSSIKSTNENQINEVYLSNLWDLSKNLQDLSNKNFDVSFKIKNIVTKKKNALKISSINLSNNGNCIFSLDFKINKARDMYSEISIKSDFFSCESLLPGYDIKELLNNLQYDATLFCLFDYNSRECKYWNDSKSGQENFSIASIISKTFALALSTLRENFSKESINYVSPLRAHPKRYYFLDRAKINTVLDTLDGNSLTEILKENEKVKSKVNDWLIRFDVSINVSTLEDVIHKLKVSQNKLELDITDVGFGISQVLPVIVQGFLSFPESLTIIEQPEIHLHPKMQADLSDLFIDIVLHDKKTPSKFLIIETHSEYLLKRLRRRMADGTISRKIVGIYFFCPGNDDESDFTHKIEEKTIHEGGAFEWPKNFYSGELLKDTIEFIKNQEY
ncbi:AAA family ATPase [Desulfobacter curvatus]|uniref:AAA family ATPase n=1 Tax=Desulfobacter curvatus TaxID=2290 RepID=UPI0012F7D720|nr:AAA family ATPase [Desulfobacter curvatus]